MCVGGGVNAWFKSQLFFLTLFSNLKKKLCTLYWNETDLCSFSVADDVNIFQTNVTT